ncbi:probable E3 SUMO-protein ligase RNF212 isoform X5 [Gorilla gorilla gorilla]|uniref:probable E3 SUMO-protein ligase RNF212 isoform X5 n=1 Tax=Gorilla gorilla gorilla TaxID=9595 RepID=UPI0008F5098C|nr:probable E3 SUMO-protein ligase RNF212 isoform X4 [Gorilla gorilla gorilla]
MANWVFCNRCFQPPHRTSCFSLTNCGHVYCDACLGKGKKNECLICKAPCRTVLLSKHTDADIQAFFMSIDSLCKKYSRETSQYLRLSRGCCRLKLCPATSSREVPRGSSHGSQAAARDPQEHWVSTTRAPRPGCRRSQSQPEAHGNTIQDAPHPLTLLHPSRTLIHAKSPWGRKLLEFIKHVCYHRHQSRRLRAPGWFCQVLQRPGAVSGEKTQQTRPAPPATCLLCLSCLSGFRHGPRRRLAPAWAAQALPSDLVAPLFVSYTVELSVTSAGWSFPAAV